MGVSGGNKDKEMAERTTILRVPAGSSVHGLSVSEAEGGASDSDELGVCIEDLEVFGGFSTFEQYVYRSAAEREGKQDAKSGPGDLDLTIYGLKKFLRLAMSGNPTVLTILYVPGDMWVCGDSRGSQLQELAPYIVSRSVGNAFLGYMQQQRQRMLGERGQLKVHRPELVEKYGYDTKYAMHILRLGFQGVELLTNGCLSLPMTGAAREYVMGVRLGQVELQEVLTKAGELETQIKDLLDNSYLPETPDTERVQKWMLETYWECWKARNFDEQNQMRALRESAKTAKLKGK